MRTHYFRSQHGPHVLAIQPMALDIAYSEADLEEKENETSVGVGVVNICGPLEHHRNWLFDSYDQIYERLEQSFEDPENRAVIMCIDSPGGDAAGATEIHRKIQRLKRKHGKKLYAYSNEQMYSAAYAVGCAADEIWVPETGGVGSVGVICALLDKTEANKKAGLNIKLLTTGARKADTQADRPLTDEIVDSMQERVDYLGNVFFKIVSKARGMSVQAVAGLEAGCFLGKMAVRAGLADEVGGWFKFLQHVSEEIVNPKPQDDSENSEMKTKAQLTKERNEAAKKLASASSESERKKCFAVYESAVQALADFEAKTKYVKKTEEKLEEDDDDEDEEEETEEEEEESEEDEEEDDDDCDEEEEEEEEEKSSKSKKSKASVNSSGLSLKQVSSLFASAVKLTGKSNVSEVIGALDARASRAGNDEKLRQDLTKLKTESKKSRVKSMLTKAKTEGRITPAEAKGLFAAGMRDSKWLRGYLSSLSPKVRSQADDLEVPDFANDQTDGEVSLKNLPKDQRQMLQTAAHHAGMSVEDYYKKMQETKLNRKTNGAAAR